MSEDTAPPPTRHRSTGSIFMYSSQVLYYGIVIFNKKRQPFFSDTLFSICSDTPDISQPFKDNLSSHCLVSTSGAVLAERTAGPEDNHAMTEAGFGWLNGQTEHCLLCTDVLSLMWVWHRGSGFSISPSSVRMCAWRKTRLEHTAHSILCAGC